MGRKVNPLLFRIVKNRNWSSVWYTNKSNFSSYLLEDINIRNYIENFFKKKPIGKTIIFKNLNFIFINIYLKKNSFFNKNNVIALKKKLIIFTDKKIFLNIKNIKNQNLDVKLIFFYIKKKIESRKSYTNVIKNIMNSVFKNKCLGIKIIIHGRINGNIMTRKQVFFHGKIPLHRINANIKYHSGVVDTIHGCIGVKIWLYFGDFIY